MQPGLSAAGNGLSYALEPIRVGGGPGMGEPPPLGQLADFLDASSTSRATAVVQCPKSMVGRVIGKGGETIKALQQYTGAMIQIDQSCDPTRVTIAGLPQALELAVSMVNDIVRGTFKGFAMLRQIAVGPGAGSSGGNTPGAAGGTPLSGATPSPVYVQGYGFVPPSQAFGNEETLNALLRATPSSSAPGTPPIAPLRGAGGAAVDPAAAVAVAAAAAAAQQQQGMSPDLAAALLAGGGVQRSAGSMPGSPYGVPTGPGFAQQSGGSFTRPVGAGFAQQQARIVPPAASYSPAAMSAYGAGLGAGGLHDMSGLGAQAPVYAPGPGMYVPGMGSPALTPGMVLLAGQEQQQQQAQQAQASRGTGLAGLDSEAVLTQLLSQLSMAAASRGELATGMPKSSTATQSPSHSTPQQSASPGPSSQPVAPAPVLDAAGLQTLLAQAALLSRNNAAAGGGQAQSANNAAGAFAAPGGLGLGLSLGQGGGVSPTVDASSTGAGPVHELLMASFGTSPAPASPLAGSGRGSPLAGSSGAGLAANQATPSKTRSAASIAGVDFSNTLGNSLSASALAQTLAPRSESGHGR